MSLSMYDASMPAITQTLQALSGILDKAQAHAEARKIDPAVLLATRLIPDMFPLSRQIQIACDFAKGTMARLAGVEVPSYADNETTIPEMKARIEKTLAFIGSLDKAAVEASADRDITFKAGNREMHFKGKPYLVGFALPNFYFHVSMAYAILRASGVELGKSDFMGMKLPA